MVARFFFRFALKWLRFQMHDLLGKRVLYKTQIEHEKVVFEKMAVLKEESW